MTDDRNRQEGTPSADQETTKPIKEREPGPDQEQARIILDLPDDVGDMYPDEFFKYMAEHPEAMESLKDTVLTAAETVMQGARAAALATDRAAKLAQSIREVQTNIAQGIAQTIQNIARASHILPEWADADELDAFFDELDELEPFLNEEIKKYPEYEGKTYLDVLNIMPFRAVYYFINEDRQGAQDQEQTAPAADQEPAEAATDQERQPEYTEEQKIIIDLLEIRRAARAAHTAQQALESAPKRNIQHINEVGYPLDKPNSIIWKLLEKDTAGQIEFNLAKSGSRQVIPAYYSINFDNLGNDIKITRQLTAFDKRVYIAISALFCAGNDVITLSQIYYAMGYKGNPGSIDFTKINDSITKMTTARIYFDNEAEARKYNYDRFRYDGSLLPIERGTGIINGKVADAAIYVFRDPPLMTFARQRGQITTINLKILQSPVSKTDANLLIEDYLIERICRAKNAKRKRLYIRILLKTLYEHTGIKTKKQMQRAPAKIKKYLDHQQKEALFSRYTMDSESITVFF